MVFRLTLILCTPVGQYPKEWHLVFFKERQNPVIEDVRRRNSMLSFIELGEGHPGIGIDEGLLVDPAHTFDIANIVGVLRSQVSGMFRFYFSKGLPFLFLAFHGYNL